MNILVTGATDFIGSRTYLQLVEHNHNIDAWNWQKANPDGYETL